MGHIKLVGDYRHLLRQMKRLPSFTKASARRSLVNELIQQSKAETDEERIKFFHTRLHSYGTMVSSINELKHLRGLDSGEKLDPREKIRATAGRVGLSVPRFADEALPEQKATSGDVIK